MSPLKRGKGLQPGKPLVRKTALRSNVGLKPGGFLVRTPFVKKRISATQLRLWQDMRTRVFVRAAGLCDICGTYLNPNVWECHHRRLRSQGGLDDMRNLIACHLSCHARAHNNRGWARQFGYIVHHPDDPATRPMLRHGHSWQLPGPVCWSTTEAPPDYQEETAA